ncbi:coat protein [Erysiphe necator associated totivirus 4]|nr:coat protein [Erysiphe necator associated totivirus 4]
MQLAFIRSLYHFFYGGGSTPKFDKNSFSIQSNTYVTAKQGDITFASELQSTTDFLLGGFNYEVTTIPVSTELSGINKRFVGDDGMYDLQSAVLEFQRTAPGMRITRTEIEALAKSSVTNDSHEAYILNMLISWLLAKFYKDNGSVEGKLEIKYSGYEDSHVRMKFNDVTDEHTTEYELGAPVEILPDVEIQQRLATKYWDKPYVLRYPATSRGAASFYLLHAFGRSKRSDINIDINLESVDFDNLYVEPIGGPSYALSIDDVPWDNPETLWSWMMDYVLLNRLEHAFGAAFELLSSIAMQPKPSFQESVVWQETALQINIAKFTPTRARIPANLEGEAYRLESESSQLIKEDVRSPVLFLICGAIINYAMWVSLYALMDNETMDLSDWRAGIQGHMGAMQVFRNRDMRAALVSIIFGKEITSLMNENCFLTFSPGLMPTRKHVTVDKVKEPGYTSRLILESIVPYVSGALLLGVVSSDFRTISCLRSSNSITADDYGTYSVEEAIQLSTLYRVFGHDITISHDRTAEEYLMFANTSECVPCTSTIIGNTRYFDRVTAVSNLRTLGRHSSLLPLATYKNKATTTYTIAKPEIMVVKLGLRNVKVRHAQVVHDKKKEVKFHVAGRKMYAEETLVHSRNRTMPDFRYEQEITALQRPIATGKAQEPQGPPLVDALAPEGVEATPASTVE